MGSKFEDTLLQDTGADGKFRKTLFHNLDEETLRILRQASTTMNATIHPLCKDRIFRNLFAHAPIRGGDSFRILMDIAPSCQHLTITVTPPPNRSREWELTFSRDSVASMLSTFSTVSDTSKLSIAGRLRNAWDKHRALSRAKYNAMLYRLPSKQERFMDSRLWEYVFKYFKNLDTLTLRVLGNPAWPGYTEIEETLIMLRYCLERSCPPALRHIEVTPVHAFGILHLRWAGFGAFREVPTTGMQLWENITSLTLHIRNPLISNLIPTDSKTSHSIPPITTDQYTLFLTCLNSYLRSFSRTLRKLNFVWMDLTGPSPLLLRPDDVFEYILLEELWLGNISEPNQAVPLIPEFAPRVKTFKFLLETHRHRPEAADGWMDFPLERLKKGSMRMDHPAFRDSTVYTAADTPRQSTVSVQKPEITQADNQATVRRSTHLRLSRIRKGLSFISRHSRATATDTWSRSGSVYSDRTERP